MVDRTKFQRWVRWVATFVGFPLAGVAARAAAGDIDAAGAAIVGGLAGGAVLGAVQAAVGGIERGNRVRWIAATGTGFAVGLTVGAAAVGYRTDTAGLVMMGACSGAAVGATQALAVPMRVIDPCPLGDRDAGAVGRRLADHLAGHRRRGPSPCDVRFLRGAGGLRRRGCPPCRSPSG
jgi:hypothetical protein